MLPWLNRVVYWSLLAAVGSTFALADEGQGVMSTENLLAIIRQQCANCRILKMEVEESGSGPIYEVKLLTRDGAVIKQEYRAYDLRLLRQEGGNIRR